MPLTLVPPTSPTRTFAASVLAGDPGPRTNTIYTPATFAEFQTALNQAIYGDDIRLDWTKTYVGNIIPPLSGPITAATKRQANGEPSYIRIIGTGVNPAGRIAPGDQLAKLKAPSNGVPLLAWDPITGGTPAPSYLWWEEIAFENADTGGNAFGMFTTLHQDPVTQAMQDIVKDRTRYTHHFVFRRTLWNGRPGGPGAPSPNGGLAFAGQWLCVTNSYGINFGGQTDAAWIKCPQYFNGPLHLENNFIDCQGMGAFVGGSASWVAPGEVCDDVIVRHNHFKLDPQWCEDYLSTDGTVTIANTGPGGVAVITGSGVQQWLTDLGGQGGNAYCPWPVFFEDSVNLNRIRVATVDSNTQVTLAAAYPITGAGRTYRMTHRSAEPRQGSILKNNLEFKHGRFIKITGNVFENCSGEGQEGVSVSVVPTNQTGGNPEAQIRDVEIAYNRFLRVGRMFHTFEFCQDPTKPSRRTYRVWFHDNLGEYMGQKSIVGKGALGGVGFWQLSGPPGADPDQFRDCAVEHNTMMHTGNPAPTLGHWFFCPGGPESAARPNNMVRSNLVEAQQDAGGESNSDSCLGIVGGNGFGILPWMFQSDVTQLEAIYNVQTDNQAPGFAGGGVAKFNRWVVEPRRTTPTNSVVTNPVDLGLADYANRNYAVTDKLTGAFNVSAANPAVVTLASGTLPAGIVQGQPFRVDSNGTFVLIRSVDSATQFTLDATYPGAPYTNVAGRITFKGYSHDGRDPGADIPGLLAATNSVDTIRGFVLPSSVTPASSSVAPGASVNITWHIDSANGAPNTNDYIALFVPGAPNASFLDWVYLNGTQTPPVTALGTDGTVAFPVSASRPVGAYEVRLFKNPGDFVIATAPLTVSTTTFSIATPTALSLAYT